MQAKQFDRLLRQQPEMLVVQPKLLPMLRHR